jgi:adenosine deaminase
MLHRQLWGNRAWRSLNHASHPTQRGKDPGDKRVKQVFQAGGRPFKQALLYGVFGCLVILAAGASASAQDTNAERKTSKHFESVRRQPSLLVEFLRRMPKGADLHNHLSGAVYAESFIRWAAQDALCVDRETAVLSSPPCDPVKNRPPAAVALQDVGLYARMLDAYSMRGWLPATESGHDHFFATFGKFGAATNGHTADMLAELRSRAAGENVQYLELMFNPDGGQAARLGASLGWNDDLGKMRDQLLSGGLRQIVADAGQGLDKIEALEQQQLHCASAQPDPGCHVQARYLYQVARGLSREMVFAQILAGFEMASRDPRVVGLNLVMAEDWYVPIHDFNLHMQMLNFLHEIYPKVHITLHAGELTLQLAPPEELFHIRASIERGHAERIGHGVDLMYEPDPVALLREMARRKIMVEVCLTSNDVILGVTGAHHPLPVYMRYGVPVALATDDAGVSRSTMTQEYLRAVETYGLKYADLKRMARTSVAYSFLPGDDLWADVARGKKASACAADKPGAKAPSAKCGSLLSASEKARLAWDLEKAFTAFESRF